jgi:DNA ligase (NAD+)
MPPTTKALLHQAPAALSARDLARLIQQANQAYYNSDAPLMPDAEYDALKDELARRDPTHPLLSSVGVAVTSAHRKVQLPVWMGSMDKVKDPATPCEAYMDKLDGVSALLVWPRDGPARLLTRGDGRVGHDVSHLLAFLQHTLPPNSTLPIDVIVRGELVLPKDAPLEGVRRNLVSGLVNAQVPDLEVAKHVHFVAYAVLAPPGMRPLHQLSWLAAHGFPRVVHAEGATDVDLDRALAARKQRSPYEVDGIVLILRDAWEDVPAGENPKALVAFKRNTTWARAVVTQVEWKVSKDGYFKPTVVFAPVHLSGVTVQRATGFNAGFIRAHAVGPGAVVHVTRSGDVIPHILEVVEPAPQGPALPAADAGTWTDTGVDLVAHADDPAIALRALQHFFSVVDVRGVGDARVAALFAEGYTRPGDALRHLSQQAPPRLDLRQLMVASNAFGRGVGKRRLEALLQRHPRALQEAPTREQLLDIPGVEAKTADAMLEGLRRFAEFERENQLLQYVGAQPAPTVAAPSTTTIVFSGFRDPELQLRAARELGHRVADNVTRQTAILVVPDGAHEPTTKEKRAVELGVRVVARSELFKQ